MADNLPTIFCSRTSHFVFKSPWCLHHPKPFRRWTLIRSKTFPNSRNCPLVATSDKSELIARLQRYSAKPKPNKEWHCWSPSSLIPKIWVSKPKYDQYQLFKKYFNDLKERVEVSWLWNQMNYCVQFTHSWLFSMPYRLKKNVLLMMAITLRCSIS